MSAERVLSWFTLVIVKSDGVIYENDSDTDNFKDPLQKKLKQFVAPMLTEEVAAISKGFILNNKRKSMSWAVKVLKQL